MEVSAESNAKFVAFRQLVYRCSQHLSREEVHAIVYIRLYKEKEVYKDVDALTVLSKLETDGLFSPWRPEGLLDIVRDLKRHDLIADIKEFLKKKWTKVKKTSGTLISLKSASDEDLHLKATFQVVISQATVLMQQIEMFQRAIQGVDHSRETTKEIVGLAAQTAQALANRLSQVHSDYYPTGPTTPPYGSANSAVTRPVATSTHIATTFSESVRWTTPVESCPLPNDVPVAVTYKSKNQSVPSTAPDSDPLDGDIEDEYVEMTPSLPSESLGEWKSFRSCDQKNLAYLYSPPPLTGSKIKCTTAKSSEQRAVGSMTTSRNVAHMNSSNESSPSHGSASFPHSLDDSPTRQHASISSPDCSPPKPTPLNQDTYYNNLRPTQTPPSFCVHKTVPAGETLESDLRSRPTYPNVVPEETVPLIPPRDIKRKYPIKFNSSPPNKFPISLHQFPLKSNQQGGERSHEGENEYTSPPTIVRHLPQDETTIGSVAGQSNPARSLPSKPHPHPAPRPKKRQSPEAPPRCSSLSRAVHNRITPTTNTKQNICTPVTPLDKCSDQEDTDGMKCNTLPPEVDHTNCTDDSGFTDELELKLLREMATNTEALLSGSNSHYYKHLQRTCQQQDDLDKAYTTVQHR